MVPKVATAGTRIQVVGAQGESRILAWRVQSCSAMAAIQNLFERFGFVKLNRYGLALTSEGRILSMRPAVLDDGIGGRIVGWQDSDLAAAELARWEPVKPLAPPVASAARVVAVSRPVAVPPPLPKAVTAAPAVAVAPAVEEPEDDWEWTIAIARARAAADEIEATPILAKPVAPMPRAQPRAQTRPPITRTQPLPIVKPMAPVIPIRAAGTPQTRIPVPTLPTMTTPPRLQPVVRSNQPAQAIPALPRRMAKGTGPVLPQHDTADVGDRTETSIELADQTRPNVVLPARVAR